MSPMSPSSTGARYWRSLDELADTAEFRAAVAREFPGHAWEALPPATRRSFLKVMGASLAFAGLTACRWPKEEIVPFAHRPDGVQPGVPRHFATSFELGGVATGVVATSFDGRPVKLEGNPHHPDSLGALSAIGQALILELYDPDRSQRPLVRRGTDRVAASWDEAAAALAGAISGDGRGAAVLAEASSSPTLAAQKARLLARYPALRWVEYEAASRDNEGAGSSSAFASPVRAVPSFAAARVIACFDADVFVDHPRALALTREFAASRRPESMSRLYVAEARHTITGGRADHRLALASSQVPALLVGIAQRLAALGVEVPSELLTVGDPVADERARRFADPLAADLADQRGHGAIVVGAHQPAAAHAVAAALNVALGNVGTGVRYLDPTDRERPHHSIAIGEMAGALQAGEVTTLVLLGGNPAYDAPADLGLAELIEKTPFSAHLALYDNETSRRCTWHLPRAHFLESWGDGRAWDGTLTLQQPLIRPLFDGWSALELVARLAGDAAPSGHDLVQSTLAALHPSPDFAREWRKMLHDGVRAESAGPYVQPLLNPSGLAYAASQLAALTTASAPTATALELVLAPDAKVHDGRFANNGWLQELPDAATKVTWDNAVLMSPATARALGAAANDVVAVTAGGVTVEAPVYVLPGMASFTLALALGYGRTAAGRVGDGVGVDAYPLRTTANPAVVRGVQVRPTGRASKLSVTQDHHAIDLTGFAARNIRAGALVREADVADFQAHPEVIQHAVHEPKLFSLWQEKAYQGEQWGMAIDLNSCTGCNACVVACQAENNIPVVGKEQVANGREMHWIRLDRYFKTAPGVGPDEVDEAEMVFQPMACVHCENAPCEQVCPVAATQHTEDGLNAMVYNRCIGTRYCANNCPYKVRRFNFFNYRKELEELPRLQLNPEVSVRSRGVMEKCTYCVQRIEGARIAAKNEQRPLADGEVTTACAQTCPARAIVFGDLNDATSEVSRLRGDHRSYAVLAELNVKPRTHYLGRLRNPAGGGEQHGDGAAAGHHDDQSHGKEAV